MDKNVIIDLIKHDPWRMDVLQAVRSLRLPDWLIGAGFVRNPVWDYLHEYDKPTPITDIDVAYFDPTDLNEETEAKYQDRLKKIILANWSVTNQARMGFINNQNRNYTSTTDAIACWPETATAIGIKLLDDNSLRLVAPHGTEDLFTLKLRMTPEFGGGYDVFLSRITKKGWLKKWPRLKII